MQMHVLKNGSEIQVKKSGRAKRVIIKIRHGKAELVIPQRGSVRRALRFLSNKEDWVIAKLQSAPKKVILDSGVSFPFFNENYQIIYAGLRGKTTIANGNLLVYGDILTVNKKVKKLLYEQLKNKIVSLAPNYAKQLGVTYQRISIRDNISRWGSCSAKGNLSFCWRLVFAPHEVVEYLVCHELAHLKQMNHSPKFWAEVAKIYPDYKRAESWLKKNGNSLYLYE